MSEDGGEDRKEERIKMIKKMKRMNTPDRRKVFKRNGEEQPYG